MALQSRRPNGVDNRSWAGRGYRDDQHADVGRSDRERELGSWETLLATPVDAVDALIGKLSPYIIIGTVQAVVVICIARLLFNLPVTGNFMFPFLGMPAWARSIGETLPLT